MQLSTALNLPNRQVSAGGLGYGASLSLDFTNGNQTLDSRITFTRASTATRTNPSGVIESVAINGARFDYDPVTLAPKGLLIEDQRTNLVTYSEQFDNAAWTKTNSTVTANAVISPDGTMDADKHIPNNGATIGINATATRVFQNPSLVSGTVYTISFYAKAAEYDQLLIGVITTPSLTGTYSLTAGTASGTGTSIISVGNGWYRCVLTFTATSTGTIQIRWSAGSSTTSIGDGTSGVFLWGAQLEAGAFATSYIPTVASQVTRSADVAVMTGTNFSSWYNATEGSMYAQYDWLGDSSFDYMFAVNDTTGNNLIGIGLSNANIYRGIVVTSGTTVASMTAGGVGVIGQVYSQAMAYKLNDFALAGGGVMRGTDTAGAVPVVTQASFNGSSGTSNLFNGHIRRIAYYPTRLTNAQLQSLTS